MTKFSLGLETSMHLLIEKNMGLADKLKNLSNQETFSVWTRRVQSDLSSNKDVSLELISVQVAPAPVAAAEVSAIILRFPHGAQLELSTAVSPRWLAELLQCLS